MANRKNTFLIKRSNVAGKIPAAGDLQLGELALNTADNILYASGTTANSILPIGWDRVARTGDTMTGSLFAPSISATTMSAESITLKNYIDFNTGTTTPINKSGRVFYDNQSHSLAYFPDIDQNVRVEMGQQLYIRGYNNTGSIIPKGTVLSIQSATNGLPNFTPTVILHYTNSQVVGLAASDIPINGNGLALSQGILSGITINSFNIGDILYASPFSAGTYVANTSSFPFTARTNQIGYVIATGTSTGEIYVSINNEDENLTLTDIERNILEGNVISTGAYEFTGMTTASTTTFNIARMRGWLVKNTNEYATLPDAINIFYTGGTNISVTNIASADSTYVLITSALTVTQQTTFPTPQQRRENIYLGKVNHPNRTSILNINNTVDYDVSPMSSLRDLWSPIRLINQGIIPSPNGANLSFNTSAGTLWGNGINWHNNQLSPNNVSISGKTPASFFYRTQTGGTSSSVTVIDPTKYDIGGVITSISPAGSNDATNQRIYLYPTGVINVLYGQTRYATLSEAVAAIQSETFIPYPNAETTGILIGVISVRNDIVADGQPLTNPDYAKFTLVSKFGESFGGTGGLSTTTLQQAYNNSTTPEIVINATLDGLSIQNGTGNADNTTHLLEGLNTAGNTTSFIRADGYISGTTFQSNGFNANNGGVTATTVSASTYYNLPTDVRVTGATYSNNTFTYTNSTGGTFNVLFNTVTGLTVNGNLTVTGDTYISGSSTTVGDVRGFSLVSTQSSGNEGGEVRLATSQTGTLSGGNITFDVYQNRLRFFESGGSNRGVYIDLTAAGAGVGTNLLSGGGGEINTASNLGSGTGLFAQKVAADLQFKSLTSTGGTVTISSNATTVNLEVVPASNFTGGTVTGATRFTNGLTANTFSATTYSNLPIDVTVTGGTYSTGTATFRNNTGGTFTVTGFNTGTTSGNGTVNYLPKWTGTTGLGNSVIQDNGFGASIGAAPLSTYRLYTYSPTGTSIYAVGSNVGVLGQGSVGLQGDGSTYGIYGNGANDLGTIGVYGTAGDNGGPFVSSIFIGGKFLAGGGAGTNYSVQLQDNTEGINKVLVSQTSDGKANWSSILSGLTAIYTNTLSATTITARNLNVTGGTQSLFSGSSSVEMVKIIQDGSGDAFVVEDVANGDASHFVINSSGNVAIGLTAPLGSDKLTISGNTGVYGTVTATYFVGDGSGLTNVTATAAVPYGLINAISTGNYLI